VDKDTFTTLVQVPHFLSLAQNPNLLYVIKEARASSVVGEELPMKQKHYQLVSHRNSVDVCGALSLMKASVRLLDSVKKPNPSAPVTPQLKSLLWGISRLC